jgi:hypothetical protein
MDPRERHAGFGLLVEPTTILVDLCATWYFIRKEWNTPLRGVFSRATSGNKVSPTLYSRSTDIYMLVILAAPFTDWLRR